MKAKPIFIMSSERSGSNFLMKLLSNHSNVSGPKAPQLLKTFFSAGGKFIREGRGAELYEDMMSVVNHPQHDWQFRFAYNTFCARFAPLTFLDFFNGFYSKYQEDRCTEYVVCKENNIFDYAKDLQSYYGDNARFIYLYRDPRDCAVSWMNVPGGFSNPVSVMRSWATEQRKCLNLIEENKLCVLKVKYEEILDHPQEVIDGILNFLGLPPEDACYSPEKKKTSDVEVQNEYWKNLNKPIMKENTRKYLSFFHRRTLQEMEKEAVAEMICLGYIPHIANSVISRLIMSILPRGKKLANRSYKKNNHDPYTVELIKNRGDLHKKLTEKYK